jgi:2-oxo-hept-3-ene-1,7-dioate hydratase
MLSEAQVNEVAVALYKAEVDAEPIPSISLTYPEADVETAYRISSAVTALKVKAGRIVKGHKIGLTSKAMRGALGATEPDYGTIFDDWFVLDGGAFELRNQSRLVEVETAFVMREALTGPGVTVADVIRATDFVMPAIEIVGMRQTGRGTKMLVDSISDAAACAGLVLGGRPMRLTDIDIRHVGATLSINGVIEESGVNSAVMGNPVNAVTWLANKLHGYGVSIEAGHVVLPGSFLRAVPIKSGDNVVAQFDTLGDVSFRAE